MSKVVCDKRVIEEQVPWKRVRLIIGLIFCNVLKKRQFPQVSRYYKIIALFSNIKAGKTYFSIKLRWKAVQSFFSASICSKIMFFFSALKYAKDPYTQKKFVKKMSFKQVGCEILTNFYWRPKGRQKLLSACISMWTESHKICKAWTLIMSSHSVFVIADYD